MYAANEHAIARSDDDGKTSSVWKMRYIDHSIRWPKDVRAQLGFFCLHLKDVVQWMTRTLADETPQLHAASCATELQSCAADMSYYWRLFKRRYTKPGDISKMVQLNGETQKITFLLRGVCEDVATYCTWLERNYENAFRGSYPSPPDAMFNAIYHEWDIVQRQVKLLRKAKKLHSININTKAKYQRAVRRGQTTRVLRIARSKGIRQGFSVGDHVLALWLGEDRLDWPGWYPATITEVFRDGTFSLLYDDGYCGLKIPIECIKAAKEQQVTGTTRTGGKSSTQSFFFGTARPRKKRSHNEVVDVVPSNLFRRVKVRWDSGSSYTGLITAVNDDGTIDVTYDDGEVARNIKFDNNIEFIPSKRKRTRTKKFTQP